MEFMIGSVSLALSKTQLLGLFWAALVVLAFNAAYLLFIWDRQTRPVTRARMFLTILVGSLVVIGTYAQALASKPFAMNDCLLLAWVAVHGWMAEEFVERLVRQVRGHAH